MSAPDPRDRNQEMQILLAPTGPSTHVVSGAAALLSLLVIHLGSQKITSPFDMCADQAMDQSAFLNIMPPFAYDRPTCDYWLGDLRLWTPRPALKWAFRSRKKKGDQPLAFADTE